MVPGVGKQIHHTCKTRCKTQATQGHRFTFCHSEGFGCKLARHGLSPSALRALCQSAHRAPNARLLAPGGGGDDRAGGPRATHLLARQPDLLDDCKVAAWPPPELLPRSLPRCCRCAPQPAALLPPPGMGNAAERVSEPYSVLAV